MKVMCVLCGKVLGLMGATSLAVEESGELKTYHFCTDGHMKEFARKKGLLFGKD
jgi:hypothetical protein